MVEGGFVAVDDNEEGAVFFGKHGEARGGLDSQGGSCGYEYVGFGADVGGCFHFFLRHGLSEGYGFGFQPAVTVGAVGRISGALECCYSFFGWDAVIALKTTGGDTASVQFNNFVGG